MNDEQREKHRLYMQRYMASHPEQREKARVRARAYTKANKEALSAKRQLPENVKRARDLARTRRRNNPNISYAGNLRRKGMTEAGFSQLLTAQGGGCFFCGKTNEDSRADIRRLAIDHDHATGRVRGILCFRCNISLGYAERGRLSRLFADMDRLNTYLGTSMTVSVHPKDERADRMASDWLAGRDMNDIAGDHQVTRSRVYQILAATITAAF